jgi:hypothetical protein
MYFIPRSYHYKDAQPTARNSGVRRSAKSFNKGFFDFDPGMTLPVVVKKVMKKNFKLNAQKMPLVICHPGHCFLCRSR